MPSKYESCPVNSSPFKMLTKPSIELPILMYHNVSNNPKLLGKFTIPQKEFLDMCSRY